MLERQSELLLNRSLERDKAIAFRQKQFVNHLSALVDSNEHRFSQIEIAISQGRHLTAEKIKAIVAEPDNEQLLSQIPKLAHAVKPPIAEDIQGLSTNAAANYDQLTAAAAAYAKRAA